ALNVWVSISAFVLGFSMLIFLANTVYSMIFARVRAERNPWRSKSIEWQLPTPVPVHNFEQIPVFDSDPYQYGTPLPAPVGRHGHINPNQALGAAMIACIVLSALLAAVGARQLTRGSRGWTVTAIGAVVLGLAAVGLQCFEYTRQHFGPTDGAFASVFCTWTAVYVIAVLCTMYWLETQVATELRARRAPAGAEGDIREADRLIAPAMDATV